MSYFYKTKVDKSDGVLKIYDNNQNINSNNKKNEKT